MSALTERLAALREKVDTSIVSDSKAPTPLSTYLAIYNRASGKASCYTDYMRGAKALHKWLSPVIIPEIDPALLPDYIPAIFHKYEIDQLALILLPYDKSLGMEYHLARQAYLRKVIVYLTLKDIMK